MIPISDDPGHPRPLFPIVNLTLIALCIAVFVYELTFTEERLVALFHQYGVVPAELVGLAPRAFGVPAWVTVFTSMFLHGGWLHLLGNMLYLFIFGDNVESAMGHVRYLGFYLLTGVLAALAQVFIDPAVTVPSVGASGAIAGVLGAYLVLFPAARVQTVIFFGYFFTVTALPAIIVIGLWGISQFLSGILSLGAPTAQAGGIAFFAHIGGFVAGLALGWLFRRRIY